METVEKGCSCLALQQWLQEPSPDPTPISTQALHTGTEMPDSETPEWFDYCSGTKRCNIRETRAYSPMILHTSAPSLFTCPSFAYKQCTVAIGS